MLFSSFAVISIILQIVIALPQSLQDDLENFREGPTFNLEQLVSDSSDSGPDECDQYLNPEGSPISSRQLPDSYEFPVFVDSGIKSSTSDGAPTSLYTNLDSSAGDLASTGNSDPPNPHVPITIPGPYYLPPGIGTCEGNPLNQEKDASGKPLKTIYCCIHHNGIAWGSCTKFYNGFLCDENNENNVFACCKGIDRKSVV